MYRCQQCGLVVPPCTSAETIVVETRPRTYPSRLRVMREVVHKKHLDRRENADDRGGTGREIVRELKVCPPCKCVLDPASAQQGS